MRTIPLLPSVAFLVSWASLGSAALYNTTSLPVTACRQACDVTRELGWVGRVSSHMRHIRTVQRNLEREYEQYTAVIKEISTKEEYLQNVLNLYSLMGRACRTWTPLARIIVSLPGNFNSDRKGRRGRSKGFGSLARLDQDHMKRLLNLTTAQVALTRLQSVYRIPVDTLANAKLDGALNHTRMSADDCYDMAIFLLKQERYLLYAEWIEETWKRLENGEKNSIPKRDLLEHYVVSGCFAGDDSAPDAFDTLVSDYKGRHIESTLSSVYSLVMEHGCANVRHAIERRNAESRLTTIRPELFGEPADSTLTTSTGDDPCRYPTAADPARVKDLRCRYVHYRKPQLMIGPFKMEELHLDPPLVRFHQVISDHEIEEMLEYGKTRVEMSPIVSMYKGKTEVYAEQRKSSVVWIDDFELPVVERLSKRTALFTGLSMDRAEAHQLNNYGVGGELLVHSDTVATAELVNQPDYADYSTAMFHLSNVAKGGFTVFPFLNVSVVPVKGAAVFWFNRKPDGFIDHRTNHLGCPILQGVKWSINKWIHRLQEFPPCHKHDCDKYQHFYL